MKAIRHAVILAGGPGTRLGPLAREIPKAMIPIAGVPVIEHQLRLMARYGVEEVWVLGHTHFNILETYLKSLRMALTIHCVYENPPLGTAGALRAAMEILPEEFFLFYGDVLVEMDLERLGRFHFESQARITLVTHPNDHPADSDLVEVDLHNRVVAVHPKPHPSGEEFHNLVSAAVYVVSRPYLERIPQGQHLDLGRDIFPLTLQGMVSYCTPEYLKDMGTPERLKRTEEDYLSGRVLASNRSKAVPAVFLDRDGVINRYCGFITSAEQIEILPGVADGITQLHKAGYVVICVTNQPGIARGLFDMEGLRLIHRRIEWSLGERGTYLDKIYFCPHHPDAGYPEEVPEYKIPCKCRKPEPGMLLQAMEDFHLDLGRSILVGDSVRDFGAAAAVNVPAVGMRGGEAWHGGVEPAIWVNDFTSAYEWILCNQTPEKALAKQQKL